MCDLYGITTSIISTLKERSEKAWERLEAVRANLPGDCVTVPRHHSMRIQHISCLVRFMKETAISVCAL